MTGGTNFPQQQWLHAAPAEVGMSADKLDQTRHWLDENAGDRRYRVVVVRDGKLVAEWNHRIGRDERLGMASAAKSIFSCMLGIAIDEGKIASADARVLDYYPEAMEVPEGEGPKPGRHARPKDRDITFRQLISNTSGYLKPDEQPGEVFHYQTFGMNILTHAISKAYGLYDVRDPEGSPGLRHLVDRKLRIPMQGTWEYSLNNFDLHAKARLHIFGYYDAVKANALDMARMGWLWRHFGLWQGRQLVPEAWLRQATQTAPDIRANCPADQWQYGYGFWTNDHAQLWPDLPRDGFSARGAGDQYIAVFAGLDLVVVQAPGLPDADAPLLNRILDACD